MSPAHSALPPPRVGHFPHLHLLPQEVPHDCFISQGVHTPFLPSPAPPRRALGGWGAVLNQAPRWLSPASPHRVQEPLRKEGRKAGGTLH